MTLPRCVEGALIELHRMSTASSKDISFMLDLVWLQLAFGVRDFKISCKISAIEKCVIYAKLCRLCLRC